ncbi:L,D-transpeptidase family protein [Microbulbifer sp. 2205BS26-8]|uniref:L,D-transpeptidase family protein n=1 Tax=Microbulbifer sp. 2205BS26-8 TaxID=3064386 RepID=UPI00273EBEC1|nr:L,D-transpeptidase family protein [Microbulbifer sp. 2205BS26-8]MDP5210358.1 L,D-transpeptidase family protein [Microbulbifer sp. 2205BS26-8]
MACDLLRQLGLAALLGMIASAAPSGGALLAARVQQALDPTTSGEQLRKAANRYRELAKHWQPIAQGEPLQAGDRNVRVLQLRKLLQLYGDYRGQPGPTSAPAGDPLRFDRALQTALENFQRRHGLAPSGVAEGETLAALAVSPTERAGQMTLNAERWDRLALPPESRYVLINIPDYRLLLVEDNQVVLDMKTVVGKSSARTPDMRSRITHIVFNPTWTVPRSILVTQLLPKARHNPAAMHRRGYRVIQYHSGVTSPITTEGIARAAGGHATLRQISGPGNTLGKLKFVTPNKRAIFLHDTQAKSLFSLQARARSHGCVRLQHPEELAYALLAPQGWDRVQIAQAASGDQTRNVRIKPAPRLYIVYMTAWLGRDGRPQFRRDIYHRDKKTHSPAEG